MVPRLAGMNDGSIRLNGHTDDSTPSTSRSCLVDADYVRRVADAHGITNLTPSAIDWMSHNVMYALRQITTNAVRYAHHSRRNRLIPQDVDAAMQHDCQQPLFGATARDSLPFRLTASGGRDLFVAEDGELELAPLINSVIPRIPIDSSLKPHWLAIEGEQPAVPENPVPQADIAVASIAQNIVPNENAQDESQRLLTTLRGSKKSEQVNLKTMTTHTLSLEQQVFFKEVTEAIMGHDDDKRVEALHSLQVDAGLQPLIARFSVAVCEGVKCNIVQHNLVMLQNLMKLVQSLCHNTHISLEKCLHELLPTILSCILNKQLTTRPESDNHWALREFASRLLTSICRRYQVLDVQSRITKVLTKVWADDASNLSTLYGSLYALNELGVETLRAVVLPQVPQLSDRAKRASADRTNIPEKVAADKINSFITKVLINYVRTQRPANLKDLTDFRNMFGGYGDTVFNATVCDLSISNNTPQRVALLPPGAPRSNNNNQQQLSPGQMRGPSRPQHVTYTAASVHTQRMQAGSGGDRYYQGNGAQVQLQRQRFPQQTSNVTSVRRIIPGSNTSMQPRQTGGPPPQ